jgi:hypothetical protein
MEGHIFSDRVCVHRLFGTAWTRIGAEEQRAGEQESPSKTDRELRWFRMS